MPCAAHGGGAGIGHDSIVGSPAEAAGTLLMVLEATMRLAHPFMPYVTEELWQRLLQTANLDSSQRLPAPSRGSLSILAAEFPEISVYKGLCDPASENEITIVLDCIDAIRSLRALQAKVGLSPQCASDAGEVVIESSDSKRSLL
jgi:valyl-tRNA synthetase